MHQIVKECLKKGLRPCEQCDVYTLLRIPKGYCEKCRLDLKFKEFTPSMIILENLQSQLKDVENSRDYYKNTKYSDMIKSNHRISELQAKLKKSQSDGKIRSKIIGEKRNSISKLQKNIETYKDRNRKLREENTQLKQELLIPICPQCLKHFPEEFDDRWNCKECEMTLYKNVKTGYELEMEKQ